VPKRLFPSSLRAQLALAIAFVTAIGIAASFVALYSGTSSRLRAQIDTALRTQVAEWNQFAARANLTSAAALRRAATQFIAGQRYHAESLIIVVQPSGGRTVSNNGELIARQEVIERTAAGETSRLLDAPVGFSTATVAEAGTMRILSQPIVSAGTRVGVLRVANPLKPVQDAQASLKRTFLVVGAVALLLAVIVGIALATLIAAPLRRMARVAAAVDEGDLSMRAGPTHSRGEVRVLSDAFDHMLDQLERTFTRQRDFVSDASHELRTPLTVIRAQVEMLDRQTDVHDRHEATVTLLRRLDELDRLVSDMLTLASAEAGQLVEPQEIDLEDFFEDLGRDLPLFGERDFQLRSVDGTLVADRDRLTQVLRNLVRNAVAHTAPGDQVTVVAGAHDGILEVSVSDTGPGIPPEQLEHIFERFRRLDNGRSRDRGGSGLGLAIARAIVEAHGGTITAESRPGRGATFRVELPRYRSRVSSSTASRG
jgi:two-component system, OmpR family, sensor kinase